MLSIRADLRRRGFYSFRPHQPSETTMTITPTAKYRVVADLDANAQAALAVVLRRCCGSPR